MAPHIRAMGESAHDSKFMAVAHRAAGCLVDSCTRNLGMARPLFIRCNFAKRFHSHGTAPEFLFVSVALLVGAVFRTRPARVRQWSSLHLHDCHSLGNTGSATYVCTASMVLALRQHYTGMGAFPAGGPADWRVNYVGSGQHRLSYCRSYLICGMDARK